MNEIFHYNSWNESPDGNNFHREASFVCDRTNRVSLTQYMAAFLAHHSQVSQLLFLFLLRQLKRESVNLPGRLLQTLPKLWTL